MESVAQTLHAKLAVIIVPMFIKNKKKMGNSLLYLFLNNTILQNKSIVHNYAYYSKNFDELNPFRTKILYNGTDFEIALSFSQIFTRLLPVIGLNTPWFLEPFISERLNVPASLRSFRSSTFVGTYSTTLNFFTFQLVAVNELASSGTWPAFTITFLSVSIRLKLRFATNLGSFFYHYLGFGWEFVH